MPRIIAHLDMDAFFAAIEERENPRFSGLPIVVGADPKKGFGRGVVSTANYPARRYGIFSALPILTAWRLSQEAIKKSLPKVVFLPVNMNYYSRVSGKVMQILQSHVPLIEQTSIDEAYLDLSFLESFPKAIQLVERIKTEIRKKEKLTASVGIGPNKLIAKIASSQKKPDGLTVVRPEGVNSFLDPLPIRQVPGIGPKTETKLHIRKIFKIADLRKIKKEELISWLGKFGGDLFDKAQGKDEGILVSEREVKSVSEQETFAKDTISASFLLEKLKGLAERVMRRLKIENFSEFKTITLTVRFADFQTKNRSKTLAFYTKDEAVFQRETWKLFLPFLDKRENPKLKPIRLLGVGVENFRSEKIEKTSQKQLFS